MPEIMMEEIIENHVEDHHLCDLKENNVPLREQERIGFFIRCTFTGFTFIWIFLIIMNELHTSAASVILLIPIALFLIGFLNSFDIADDDIEGSVFSTTFIAIGLIVSIPMITYFNRNKENKELTHLVYMAMVATLFSNLHYWTDKSNRHVCCIIRSCLETIAITLYAYALSISFLDL